MIPSRRAAAILAAGVLMSAAGSAQAAVFSYYVGVDVMQTFASGEFAGQANPNYNRLTFLYAHPNETSPASSHYHSKGIYRYQPRQQRLAGDRAESVELPAGRLESAADLHGRVRHLRGKHGGAGGSGQSFQPDRHQGLVRRRR